MFLFVCLFSPFLALCFKKLDMKTLQDQLLKWHKSGRCFQETHMRGPTNVKHCASVTLLMLCQVLMHLLVDIPELWSTKLLHQVFSGYRSGDMHWKDHISYLLMYLDTRKVLGLASQAGCGYKLQHSISRNENPGPGQWYSTSVSAWFFGGKCRKILS